MRALALAATLALAAVAARAVADAPPTLDLAVGEETEDLGTLVRCDDLTVVAVKANGRGVRATRPGATTCSFDVSGGGGIRHIYRIVVHPPPPAGRGDRPPARGEG